MDAAGGRREDLRELRAEKRIYFRSDSAAYQAEVINHYSQPERTITITADLDGAVRRED